MRFKGAWIGLVVVLGSLSACGPTPIDELNDSELRSVCKEFAKKACTSGNCTESCCDKAGLPAAMKDNCPATVDTEDVESCADAFSADENNAPICVEEKGGCVFDALDDVC